MSTPARQHSTPTSVYLYYDRSGILIYVGVTATGIRRNRQHNASKAWWPFVASQTVEHYDSRPSALTRERQLIVRFEPPFNKQHNVRFAVVNQWYRDMAAKSEDAFACLDMSPRPLIIQSRDVSRVTTNEPGIICVELHEPPAYVCSTLKYDKANRAVAVESGAQIGHVYNIANVGANMRIFIRLKAGVQLAQLAGAVMKMEYEPTRIRVITVFKSHGKMGDFLSKRTA